MQFIVDANILLASFLKDALTRELLLDPRLALYAPEYLIKETSRHLEKNDPLRNKIKLTDRELGGLFQILTQGIQVVPRNLYENYLTDALLLAPHKEDAPYLALGLALNVPIWSNDKGLKRQDRVKVYTTSELLLNLQKLKD